MDTTNKPENELNHLRFHLPHKHLGPVFGEDWFALKAEAFARFFGTPVFLVSQTGIVGLWIVFNILVATRIWHFDEYPFILLNLAFSLQAAYAAPLILLAQTRQADRDKAHSEADAKHREDLACNAAQQTANLLELINQNTKLTELTNELSKRIEQLTAEMHAQVIQKRPAD